MGVDVRRARRVMPGGVSSPVRAFGAVGGDPPFISSGSGSHVTDTRGRTYVDLVGSWGPLILGHAHAEVVEAVREAASRGTSFGAPTETEVLLAETIVDALASVEMVRFVNSGTEAAMSALRLARAATGRSKFLKFAGCYHGHADPFLAGAGSGVVTLGLPDSPGVTDGARADTVIAPFNSEAALDETFTRFGPQLACAIVEPIAANMGVVPPAPGWLESVRKRCTDAGALLIFDEVVTGFRVSYAGAQGAFGIDPDITVLGKVIGGGLPVGAYGGSRDLMGLIAPSGSVYQAGTLSGNPISMAAGLATLTALKRENPYERLEKLGARIEKGVAGLGTVQRAGSMFTLFFTPGRVEDLDSAKAADTEAFGRFFHRMLDRGIYWPPSPFEAAFISAAHTEADIDDVVAAAGTAIP